MKNARRYILSTSKEISGIEQLFSILKEEFTLEKKSQQGGRTWG